MNRPARKRWNGARQRWNRGGVALEAAFCLPPLVLILTMAVDTAWISLLRHQLGHAARLASRYGITGRADVVPNGTALVALCPGAASGASGARIDHIRAIITAEATGLLTLADLCLGVGSYAGYQGIGRPEPLADINGNGRHDAGEAFTDINANGSWDGDQAVPTPGGGDQIAVYILRYTAHPLVGLTPGLDSAIPMETRVVVRNEPF
jgi:TadE-like protein